MATRHKDKHGLTPRQAMAVEDYILHGSMTNAYRAAGYSTRGKPDTINRRAIDLFRVPAVAARVQVLREENAKHSAFTREEALDILARAARGELPTYIEEVWDGQGQVCRTVRARHPIQAIQRLIRMCGWDKSNAIEAEGITITLNIGRPDE